jgi:N-acetyl-D-muramate 6-phosphate phosphatase
VRSEVAAVLFDLDGTLIDSAPDLAAAANEMREARGMPALPYERLRPHAGSGARGMLGAALAMAPGHDAYDGLREEFLWRYEARMLVLTRPFGAAQALLDALDRHAVPWGIVTNKAMRLAEPLTRALGLLQRAGTLVGGDSTPRSKPHPDPLLEAARQLRQPARACIYVGDDPRDVYAARAAGMGALAAGWGYLGPDLPIRDWGADFILEHPDHLLKWLELA